MRDPLITGLFSFASALVTAIFGPILVGKWKARSGKPGSQDAAAIERTGGASIGEAFSAPTAAPSARVWLRERTPAEVIARIKAIPPLSRPSVSQELFEGKWVRWDGTVYAVRDRNWGVHVAVRAADESSAFLSFDKSRRTELLDLREGDRLVFEAEVKEVDDQFVDVINPTILSHEHADPDPA